MKKLEARDHARAAADARTAARSSPDQPVTVLELGARPEAALKRAGIETISQALTRLEEGGDEAMLDVEGFGRKSLADLKKRLRQRGLLPEATEAEAEAA